ncbi:hypothetical protein Pint_14993 [Pistacia integerrima]|uniref:Uncharacterized protein n=1 Tax=Pistacia integerrima TaxID=434235 RepID=A0ACC0ZAE7_9ROSI|nr:hypothetical protein Pint_14993 [Pistacia integerrima]
MMEIENQTELVRLCLEAAGESRESIEKWRRQRRSLERLPAHLADSLLRHLIRRRLLFPSLLEVFKRSVEVINLRGENYVDGEWLAYLGAFRYLRSLNLAYCHKISSSAIWPLAGMSSLKELDISRCVKVTDAGIKHLLSIPTLEKLCLSETGVTENGVELLSSLKNLSVLDLGGLPVTDPVLSSLQVLTKLQYLDLWGSKISNEGACVLEMFPRLSFLNLAWTNVTKLPKMLSLECLNLSNCTIDSILELNEEKAPLVKLSLSGTTFVNEAEAFLHIETSFLSFLDVSNSSFNSFCFLPEMKALEHLDLSSSIMRDDTIEMVVCMGANLRNLNLSNTRISSARIGVLAGHLPNLEIFSLSGTQIDDVAMSYIGMMTSLKAIDLSNTDIKGFIRQVGAETDLVLSLTALQSLNHLERLNLEQTQVRDAALSPPPETLKLLDLRGCWLLSEDSIMLFCKRNPQIEVRHERRSVAPSDQVGPNRPSPSRISLMASQMNKKPEQLPLSLCFIDQRLKYSREELLELQYSTLSLELPHDSDDQEVMRLE